MLRCPQSGLPASRPLVKTAPLILSTTSFLLLGTVLINAQTTSIWDGSTGLWNNAARWSTNPAVPNGNYIAELNSGAAALSTAVTLAGLNMSGGEVVADASLTVNNASLQYGTLTGSSAVTFNGAVDFGASFFTIGGSGLKTFAGSTTLGTNNNSATLYLRGGTTVRNTGSFLVQAGDGVSGYNSQIYFNTDSTGPSVLRNEAGGTFTADIAAGSTGRMDHYYTDAGNVFQNAGSFVKKGAGEYNVGITFANTGSVDVQTGQLNLLAGDGGSTTGDLTAAAGTVTSLNGTFTFGSGASVNSQGTVISTGDVNLNSGSGLSAAALEINSGAFAVNTGATLQASGTALNGGALTGTADLTLGGTVDFGPNSFTVGGSGVKTFSGTTTFGEPDAYATLYLLGGATLRNTGSFLQRAGDGVNVYNSRIYFNSDNTGPAVLRNEAGGTFTADIAANSTGRMDHYHTDAGNVFQNAGSFVKKGAGEFIAGTAFANTGSVDVQGGRLSLHGGDGGATTGDLTAAAGTVTSLNGAFTFGSGASVSSQGTVISAGDVNLNSGSGLSAAALEINSGVFAVNTGATLQASGAALNGGTLTGTADLTLGGAVDVGPNGFTIGGSGVKTFSGSATFGGTDAYATLYLLGGATLRNAGSFLHRTGDGVNGYYSRIYFNTDNTGPAVLRNEAGGTFTADIAAGSTGNVEHYYTDPGSVFQNAGSFVKTGAGDYNVNVAFANTGSVDVQGGRLSLHGGDGGTTTGDLTGSAGTVTSLQGTFTFGSGASVNSLGTVISAGDVNLNSGSSLSAAALEINSGVFAVNTAAALQSALPASSTALNGGTLTGTADMTLGGTVDVGPNGFTIGGSGVKTFSGSATFGEIDNYATLYLQGGAMLRNTGSFLHRAGDGVSGYYSQIYFNTDNTGPSVLRNEAGATFTAAGATGNMHHNYTDAGNVFQNAGAFVKTGAGEYSVGTAFANTGSVDVQAGRLTLSGGDGGSTTGDFTAGAGAVIALAGGTFTFGSGVSIQGQGTVQVNGGTLNVSTGTAFQTNAALSGGTLTGAGAPVFNGTVDFGNDFTVGGSGVKTFAGSTTFGEIDNYATLYLQGGATLRNTGSFLHRAGDGVSGYNSRIYLNTDNTGPSVLRNEAGGTFTADIAAGATGNVHHNYTDAGNVFQNAGSFVKTGAGEYNVNVAFANTGTVDVQGGRLSLHGGDGGSTTGSLTGSAGTVTSLLGTFTFGSGASVNSLGTVISAGDVNLNLNPGSGFSAAALEINSGVFAVNTAAALQSALPASSTALNGGTLTGTADMTLGGTVDFGNDFTVGGSGVKTFAGSTTFGETNNYATLYLQGGATLRNTGSFLHRAGDGVSGYNSRIYLNTDGTGPAVLRNEAGGTFTADIAAGSAGHLDPYFTNAGNTFQNAGAFVKTGAGEYNVNVAFANTGSVNVQAGSVNVNGGDFTNEGAIQVAGGAVMASSYSFTQSVGGMLTGTGTIESPTMTLSGTVSPGSSPGTLTLDGDVTLTPVAVLQFELGPQSGPNDFLSITGSLVLDGMLNIVALPGLQTGLYNLITAGGGLTNQGLEFGTVPEGFTGTIGVIGNVVQLQVLTLPVPETSSSLLMLLAAAGLTGVRRRPAARTA